MLVTKIFGVEKSIFFDFSKMSSNHFLSMNMAWKCVLEALGASFWQFSSGYGGIMTPCKNLKFSKNAIFYDFLGFFDAGRFGRKNAQKRIKKWNFSKMCSLDPKDASRYLGWHHLIIWRRKFFASTKFNFLPLWSRFIRPLWEIPTGVI